MRIKTKIAITVSMYLLFSVSASFGENMQNVILFDVSGEERSLFKKLKTLKDNQLIVLNLASSTCKPCEKELPVLNDFVDSLKGKVELWIIYVGDAKEVVEKIKLKNKISNKTIMLPDPFSTYGKKFNVDDPGSGLPKTFLVNNKKEIVHSTTGFNLEEFEKLKQIVKDSIK